MTEQEARGKWCPFTRVSRQMSSGQIVSAGNRVADRDGSGIPSGSRCISSACMAWRETSRSNGVASGYCGIAGFPE